MTDVSATSVDQAWWISWYNTRPLDSFELHSPWWVSGERCSDDAETVVAAVRAASEDEARAAVAHAYDERPTPDEIEWRFVEALDSSPFCGRFPQANWMAWDDERTCACPAHPTSEISA
jgi:hypothetical protein